MFHNEERSQLVQLTNTSWKRTSLGFIPQWKSSLNNKFLIEGGIVLSQREILCIPNNDGDNLL